MYIADITSLDVRLKENRIVKDKSAKMKKYSPDNEEMR